MVRPFHTKANAMTAPRLPYPKLAPKAYQGFLSVSEIVSHGPLGPRLTAMVFLRVSQINGCAFCLDMHWRELVKMGMDPRHINTVQAWREASWFTSGEQAALDWAERVTRIPHQDPDDEAFARLREHFTDEEIAHLGFAIAVINAWNRLSISFRNPVPA
jgi:AhpD family alkylhydroperoxidase